MMNRLLRHLRISGRRTTFLTLGAGLILVVAVTAAIAQSTQVIKACYDPKSGALRIDTTEKPCDSNKERALSWNQQGPAGPAGPAGPEGPAGSDGSSDADTLDGQDSIAFLPRRSTRSEILTSKRTLAWVPYLRSTSIATRVTWC